MTLTEALDHSEGIISPSYLRDNSSFFPWPIKPNLPVQICLLPFSYVFVSLRPQRFCGCLQSPRSLCLPQHLSTGFSVCPEHFPTGSQRLWPVCTCTFPSSHPGPSHYLHFQWIKHNMHFHCCSKTLTKTHQWKMAYRLSRSMLKLQAGTKAETIKGLCLLVCSARFLIQRRTSALGSGTSDSDLHPTYQSPVNDAPQTCLQHLMEATPQSRFPFR